MTVSQVYGDLKAAGLIETRPGSGSFVTSSGHARLAAARKQRSCTGASTP